MLLRLMEYLQYKNAEQDKKEQKWDLETNKVKIIEINKRKFQIKLERDKTQNHTKWRETLMHL